MDDDGFLVAALLIPAAPNQEFYGVQATFDEDEGRVVLRVSDYRQEGGFEGLRATSCHLDSARSVLLARRTGSAYAPSTPAQPSADVLVIVRALDDVWAAVEAVARNVSRPCP